MPPLSNYFKNRGLRNVHEVRQTEGEYCRPCRFFKLRNKREFAECSSGDSHNEVTEGVDIFKSHGKREFVQETRIVR